MKEIIKRSLIVLLLLMLSISGVYAFEKTEFSYQSYVQDQGWLNPVAPGELSGTVGIDKNLEGFKIDSALGTVYYTSHVSYVGWQEERTNGMVSGPENQDGAIEAIKIRLDDNLSQSYDIYYRVHSKNLGWLDWASNGQEAGTTELGIPIQALEIQLKAKGEPFTEPAARAYINSSYVRQFSRVMYQVHSAKIGWQDYQENGNIAGTVGEGLQAEGIRINAPDLSQLDPDSHITYSVHGQYYGWQDMVEDNNLAGSEGLSLNIQAIRINLTGKISALSDIYYRTHVSKIGWLDWTKNGADSGTTGLSLPIEAIEILILPKNSTVPGDTENPFFSYDALHNMTVTVQSSVENKGWLDPTDGRAGTGTEGIDAGIEAVKMTVPDIGENSGIIYNLFIENIGWQGEHRNGEEAGTTGQNLQAEAISIRLEGSISELFDVYYSTHCQDQGWLGWTANNNVAGTSNGNKKLECLKVQLVLKGEPAPNNGIEAFREIKTSLSPESIPNFNLICAVVQHEGGASYEGALAVISCIMNRCDTGLWGGTDPVSVITAPGQFASYLSGAYVQFLVNPGLEVQRAVLDCFNGVRSHPYTSFRSYPTTGSVNIGGNWFF